MLPVGSIVVEWLEGKQLPPPLHAFDEEGVRRMPFAWEGREGGGYLVRIPVGKQNLELAGDYFRSAGFKVRCDFVELRDPFKPLPPVELAAGIPVLPADPVWEPEAESMEELAEEPSPPVEPVPVPAAGRPRRVRLR
jgi:hypothetical protein